MKKIWQNADGTWSHHMDSKCKWDSHDGCATDLRFSEEWHASDCSHAIRYDHHRAGMLCDKCNYFHSDFA